MMRGTYVTILLVFAIFAVQDCKGFTDPRDGNNNFSVFWILYTSTNGYDVCVLCGNVSIIWICYYHLCHIFVKSRLEFLCKKKKDKKEIRWSSWFFFSCSAVFAINSLYTSLGYPLLPGWVPYGLDPCGDKWHGVLCVNSNVTAM